MSAGWETKKLGDVCAFTRGPFGGSLKKNIFVDDGYAVYEQRHAIYDSFAEVRYFINEEKFHEMQRFELHPGDLIMSCSGTMGKVAIVPEKIKPGIINQALLRFATTDEIDVEFLKLWMESPNFQDGLDAYSKGAAIKNVASVKVLKEIEIPVPPIEEQRRIVAVLDEALAGVQQATANTERNLANTQELFDAHLQAIFANPAADWEEKPLNELALITSGYSFKSGDFSPVNSVNSIKITNVGVKEFVEESNNLLPQNFKSQYSKFLVKKGDIVIALTRSVISTGLKVAIVPESYDKALLNQRVASVRGIDGIALTSFLYSFLCSSFVKEYVLEKAKTLMQPNLSIRDLSALKIQTPSLQEQHAIVAQLDDLAAETQHLQAIYRQKLAALQELKQSILQQAFTSPK